MRRLTTRLAALTPRLGPPARFQLVVIQPDEWPAVDRDAYDEARAAGDALLQDAIIERVTGKRVGRQHGRVHTIHDHAPVRIIDIRMREDGPQ